MAKLRSVPAIGALFILILAQGTAWAQSRPDPAQYLPPANELPRGLERQPDRDQRQDEAAFTVAFVNYLRRPTDERPPASLDMSVAATDSSAYAQGLFQQRIAHKEAKGFSFTTTRVLLNNGTPLCQDARVGRSTTQLASGESYETVLILFRLGAVVAETAWTGLPGEPNYEEALNAAALIQDRLPRPEPEPANAPAAQSQATGDRCDARPVNPPREVDVQITASMGGYDASGSYQSIRGTVINNSYDWAATNIVVTVGGNRARLERTTLEPGGTAIWSTLVSPGFVYTPSVTWEWLRASCLNRGR